MASAISANKAELIAIANAVASEKMIDKSIVIEAMEEAIQKSARNRYGAENDIRAKLDPQTGDLFDALHGRLATVLGKDFAENALPIDAERDGIGLTGYAALPTYSRGAAVAQFLFVNGRPVRDKLLLGALRGAYHDFLSRDRHPAAALFIDCDPHLVDVNVHPAKSEVRFRDPGMARGLIVSALRHALAEAGHRASSTVADATLGAFRPEPGPARVYQMDRPSQGSLRAALYRLGAVESENYSDDGVAHLQVRLPRADWNRLMKKGPEPLF